MRCGPSGEWRRKRGHGNPVCKSVIRNAAAIGSIYRLDAGRSTKERIPLAFNVEMASQAERLFGLEGEIKAAVQANEAHAIHPAAS